MTTIPGLVDSSHHIAIMPGSYGVGFGPLAYNAPCPWSSRVACGQPPFVIEMGTSGIANSIRKAKKEGCIALTVSIVRSTDGGVMSVKEWQAAVRACRENGVILIVDEALTAARCGAPFAYQLPEYHQYGGPDFIIFGKGIRTNGLAVDWQGASIKHMGIERIEDRIQLINQWHKRYTEAIPTPELLESWGTITLAQKQDWPQQAREIGVIPRNVLNDFGLRPTFISGLHSLIWLWRDDQRMKRIGAISAKAGEAYTRWLPCLDALMTDGGELKAKIFSIGSLTYRKILAAFFVRNKWWIGYCSVCGDTIETGEDREGSREPCLKYFARPCENCEPGEHTCR